MAFAPCVKPAGRRPAHVIILFRCAHKPTVGRWLTGNRSKQQELFCQLGEEKSRGEKEKAKCKIQWEQKCLLRFFHFPDPTRKQRQWSMFMGAEAFCWTVLSRPSITPQCMKQLPCQCWPSRDHPRSERRSRSVVRQSYCYSVFYASSHFSLGTVSTPVGRSRRPCVSYTKTCQARTFYDVRRTESSIKHSVRRKYDFIKSFSPRPYRFMQFGQFPTTHYASKLMSEEKVKRCLTSV
jgi:hypothetical protein